MALPWNLCLITGFSFTLNGTKTNQTMMEKKKKKSLRPKSDVPFPGYQQVMLERAGAAEAQGVCDKVLLPSFQTLGPDSVSASQTPVC